MLAADDRATYSHSTPTEAARVFDTNDGHRADAGLPQGAAKLLLATIGFCIVLMIVLAVRRAGWLDEYWTVWHTDPANGFAAAYWTRWIHDTQHPPTFYALSWLLAPLTGPTLIARRLVVNGLGLLLVAGTILACRREGGGRRDAQPLLFALLMASGPYFLTYFAEHRSYFLGIAAASCLVATVRRLHLDAAAGARLSTRLAIWLSIDTLIALNLHYTLSLCLLTLLGLEALWLALTGHLRRAGLVAAAATVALVPLAANLAVALSLHRPVTVTNTPLGTGWATIAFMLAIGVAVNVVLAIQAVPGLVALVRRPRPGAADGRATFALLLFVALTLLAIMFAGMHVVTRNMYPRLLIGLIPLASALLAELAARRSPSRLVVTLACLNAAAMAGATTVHELRNPRWEKEVPAILAARRACPTTRVLAYDTLYLLPPDNGGWHMRGQAQAMALSYRMIARKYGFPVHVVPVDGPAPTEHTCPTLVWLEHNFFRPNLGAEELAHRAGLSLSGRTFDYDRGDSHSLLRIEPEARLSGGGDRRGPAG